MISLKIYKYKNYLLLFIILKPFAFAYIFLIFFYIYLMKKDIFWEKDLPMDNIIWSEDTIDTYFKNKKDKRFSILASLFSIIWVLICIGVPFLVYFDLIDREYIVEILRKFGLDV